MTSIYLKYILCNKKFFFNRADYWKSNERKFCDFCKCWIADNKPSISFHENGKRHKAAVAKRITDISRNSIKAEKEKQKMDQDMRKMEDAALKSYAKDISLRADMTARSIQAFSTVPEMGPSNMQANPSMSRQIDPLRLPGNSDDEDDSKRPTVSKNPPAEEITSSLWVEAKSDEGYSYYWNVKTNNCVWEEPEEGFMTIDEYEKINQIAIAQQEISLANEAKKFQNNVDEELARTNREKLKQYRKKDDEKKKKEKQKERETYKTAEDVISPGIGQWQAVESSVEEPQQIDYQLPKFNNWVPQVVSQSLHEPPAKKFKEKTITTLQSEESNSSSLTFKKRKIQRGNARQRINDD